MTASHTQRQRGAAGARMARAEQALVKTKRSTAAKRKVPVNGSDPDTRAGLSRLKQTAQNLSTLDAVESMRQEIRAVLPLSPGRVELLVELDKRQQEITDGKSRQVSRRDAAKRQHLDAAMKLRQAAAKVRQLETAPQQDAAGLETARRALALRKRQEQQQYRLLSRDELQLADLQLWQAKADLRQLEAAPQPDAVQLEAARAQVAARTTELTKWRLEQAWGREGQKVPSWDELPGYAAKIPRRRDDEQPHSMLTHLLQRLSDARNGDGPPVRVRAALPDGTIRYEPVTEDNYHDVVKAAGAFRWEGYGARNRRAIEKLIKDWRPLPVSQEAVDTMVSEWRKKLQTTGFPEDENGKQGPDLATAYQSQLEAASRKILEWVEPGVRDLVGLPGILVHGPDDPKFKPEDEGEYNAKTKVIHLVSAKLKAGAGEELLLHEFGHHIEDQGPTETWGSFASFLGRLGRGANLMPQQEYWGEKLSNNPLYCWPDKGSRPKLPRAHDGYSLQYYLTGLTESIPLALENLVPDDPGGATDTNGDNYDPEYIALVMPAIRPEAARKAGMDLWTWL